MNILLRKTFSGTILAIVREGNGNHCIGEGMNMGEAVGNLVLQSSDKFTTPLKSIRWDMAHEFTKHYVKSSLKNESIYERPTTIVSS